MKVGNAMVVTIEYVLMNDHHDVIESNIDTTPLVYLHGAGNIIEGLEDGLEDLEAEDHFEITVDPKDGYGHRNPALITKIERSRFPADEELKIGQIFALEHATQSKLFRICDIFEDSVSVDANHELAGQTLIYKGKVLDVREASEDELGNGYVRESGV